ncbi:response regulator transcription factor [Enterococcus termitis]|uniref:OmpR/PhoB-type domain-containing protein n=1 Tax=Enterococcus termitis TaxID=332950 RepID=A0A1E5H0I2_9ENTE|nr:winged helix-turn-helix domain-containing protein [Enterococcus termitis]OEG18130.1 hypothetical protein BCR25_16685 [Enterococcus termitis]OJG97163.1 hypothetical protein RV18_GL001028 [Enterococcus termitis]
MGKIGLIYLEFEKKEVKTDFLEKYSNIVLLRDKEELFEELYQLEGVIVVDEEKNKLGEVCEIIMTIKKQSTCFSWVVSSIEKDMDRLVYLQLGADFVINKNSSQMEKELIIKNSLRRNHIFTKNQQELQFNGQPSEITKTNFHLVPENLSVKVNGKIEISLTRLEFQLLEMLSQNPRMTFSYEELQKHIYGDISEDRQYRITNLMYHLRRKIDEADDSNKNYIKTVRSRGYMLNI